MTDIVTLHRRALDHTDKVVAGIRSDQWAAPTPCDGWDVRTLLNHVVSGNWWAAALAAGATIPAVGSRFDGDLLGADPLDAYRRSGVAAAAAFDAPGALEAPCAVSYGPVPGSVYAGHRVIDVLIHGWDLAVATGQDTAIDDALVEGCWDIVRPQADLLRASGAFGEAAAAEGESDPQRRLLGVLGRTARS